MRTLPAVVGGLLTAEEAAARLGVKPATLYAYVSRGQLRRERGPDGRSRFALPDLDRLGRQGRRDRAAGAELSIESALTAIEDGAIFHERNRAALCQLLSFSQQLVDAIDRTEYERFCGQSTVAIRH